MAENKDDLEKYKKMIDTFICTDLKDLLGCFKLSKIGLKNVLIERVLELLETKNEDVNKKIVELYNARYKSRHGRLPDDKTESVQDNLSNKNPTEPNNNTAVQNNNRPETETVMTNNAARTTSISTTLEANIISNTSSTLAANNVTCTTSVSNTLVTNNTNRNPTLTNVLATNSTTGFTNTSNTLLTNNTNSITSNSSTSTGRTIQNIMTSSANTLFSNTAARNTSASNTLTNDTNTITSSSSTSTGRTIQNIMTSSANTLFSNTAARNTSASNTLTTNALNSGINSSNRPNQEVNQNVVTSSSSGVNPLLLRNMLNIPNQSGFDSNLRRIVNSIQINREAISDKFRTMPSYKYIGEIEDVSLISHRNSSNNLCYKSVICLNKINIPDFDFTKFHHVDRNQLMDFFRTKKYEIHLRFGYNLSNIYVPNQIKIQIDRRPFYYSKRNDIQSVNLTPYFNRFFKTFNPISVEICDPNRVYYCGIYIFKKITGNDFLTNYVFNNPVNANIFKPTNNPTYEKINKLEYVKSKCVLSTEQTIRMIGEKLRPVDSDFQIETDYIKVSLICPLTQLRIKIPSRGKMCKHLQCFDLESYILLNEKCEKWLCPICDLCIVYTNLVVDNFSKELIDKCKNLDEVKINADGKVIEEEKSQVLTLETSLNGTIQIDDLSISNESIKISKIAPNDSCIILD